MRIYISDEKYGLTSISRVNVTFKHPSIDRWNYTADFKAVEAFIEENNINDAFVEISGEDSAVIETEEVFGDVNQDGNMNLLDIVLLQKYLLGTYHFNTTQFYNADITQDGIVNIFDRLMLENQITQK